MFTLIYNLGEEVCRSQKLSAIKMVVQVMGSDWYWMVEDRDNSRIANDTSINSNSNQLYIKANETLKFVALSIDVNHGYWYFFNLKPNECFFVPDEGSWMI